VAPTRQHRWLSRSVNLWIGKLSGTKLALLSCAARYRHLRVLRHVRRDPNKLATGNAARADGNGPRIRMSLVQRAPTPAEGTGAAQQLDRASTCHVQRR
jgi:hypothetical protein